MGPCSLRRSRGDGQLAWLLPSHFGLILFVPPIIIIISFTDFMKLALTLWGSDKISFSVGAKLVLVPSRGRSLSVNISAVCSTLTLLPSATGWSFFSRFGLGRKEVRSSWNRFLESVKEEQWRSKECSGEQLLECHLRNGSHVRDATGLDQAWHQWSPGAQSRHGDRQQEAVHRLQLNGGRHFPMLTE